MKSKSDSGFYLSTLIINIGIMNELFSNDSGENTGNDYKCR